MAIKVIVELRAKPGGRDALKNLLEGMIAGQGSSLRGFLEAPATRCWTTQTSSSRSPIGSRSKRAQRT